MIMIIYKYVENQTSWYNMCLLMPTQNQTGDSQPKQIQRHQQVTWPGGLLPSNWLTLDLPYPGLL